MHCVYLLLVYTDIRVGHTSENEMESSAQANTVIVLQTVVMNLILKD